MATAILPEKTRRLFKRSDMAMQELGQAFSPNALLSLENAMGFTHLKRHPTKEKSQPLAKMPASWAVVQRIRAARLANGWTQQELANRSGIKRANLARLETGKHAPRVDTVELLARALSLSLAELFEFSEAASNLRSLNEARSRVGVATLRENLRTMREKGIIDARGKRIRKDLPVEMREGTSDAV